MTKAEAENEWKKLHNEICSKTFILNRTNKKVIVTKVFIYPLDANNYELWCEFYGNEIPPTFLEIRQFFKRYTEIIF
jgi:hypothetical protein